METGVALGAQTAWNQLELLGNRLMLIGAEIGKSMLPGFKSLVEVLNDFVDRGLSQIQEMGPTFEAWGQKVADAVRLIGTVFEEWPNWLTLLELSFKEAFIKISAIAGRLGTGLKNLFKDLFVALVQMTKNAGAEMAGALKAALAAITPNFEKTWLEFKVRNDISTNDDIKRLNQIRNTERAPSAGNIASNLMRGVNAPTFNGLGGNDLFGNLPGLSNEDQKRQRNARSSIVGRRAMMDLPGQAREMAPWPRECCGMRWAA